MFILFTPVNVCSVRSILWWCPILYLCSWFCRTVHFFLWIILFLSVNFLKCQHPHLYAVHFSDSLSFRYVFTLAFFFFTFFNSWTSVICGGKEALEIDDGSGFHLYPPKNMVARINLEKVLGNNIKSYLIKQLLKGILQVYQLCINSLPPPHTRGRLLHNASHLAPVSPRNTAGTN